MLNFYELGPKRGTSPLTKEQILKLQGGDFRGEKLIACVHNAAKFEYHVLEVQVKNQMRSQKLVHSEGYLWLKSESFNNSKDFRYDIASGKVTMPVFESWISGRISLSWQSLPAFLFPKAACSDPNFLARALDTKARHNLLLTLGNYADSIPTICNSIEEKLGQIDQLPTDPARRILHYIPFVGPRLADDLRAVALAKGSRGPLNPTGMAA
jgi:hypothetical protein